MQDFNLIKLTENLMGPLNQDERILRDNEQDEEDLFWQQVMIHSFTTDEDLCDDYIVDEEE
nr:hypothetical protein [Fredinandcohnia onubensis]